MKKSTLITVTAIVIIVLALFFWVKNSYNGLVKADEQVKAAWSQVENVYQRRADLIPNLVATVKGYAEHESKTLEQVVAARAKATSITLSADDLTEENLAKYQQAQGELSGALKSLLAVTESYPNLKANENFRDLQVQLEGTENRISTARTRYTQAVKDYNTSIKKFPTLKIHRWRKAHYKR